MPFCGRDGNRIYWKLEGRDDAPPLVLLNSIGTDMDLWAAALPVLLGAFKVLRIDTRGHGASDVPSGDYALGGLADDVLATMTDAGIGTAMVAGVSLGGMIAMQMALAQPGRVAALGLVCTSATMDRAAWTERVRVVREAGMEAIADLAMTRFLSPGFIAAEPAIAASAIAGRKPSIVASTKLRARIAESALAAVTSTCGTPARRKPTR